MMFTSHIFAKSVSDKKYAHKMGIYAKHLMGHVEDVYNKCTTYEVTHFNHMTRGHVHIFDMYH